MVKQSKKNKKKRTKKQTYQRLLVGLLIGIVLFLTPFAFDMYTKSRQQPEVNRYQQVSKRPPNKLGAALAYNAQIKDYQKTGNPKFKPDYKNVNTKTDQAIGFLSIPSIKIDKMLMYYGTSNTVLNKGLGVLEWASLPTGGKNTRSIITGHSGLANRVYFDNIKDMKNGDVIYLNTYDQKLAYAVYGRKVIKPDDKKELQKLYVKSGKDELVLVTCTPVFLNTHRLLIYAKRVPLKDAQAKKVIRRDLFSLTHIWLALVLLFILALFTWFIVTTRKEKKEQEPID